MSDGQGKIVGIRFDAELLAALEAAAKANRVNLSSYARMVIAAHLRKEGFLA
jgi:hypothetical protein